MTEGLESSHIQVSNLFLNPSPRDECPSVSPLYHCVTQRRSVNTLPSPLVCRWQGIHLNSSSVFCGAKYRGGVRRTEGLKCFYTQCFNF